MFLYGSFATYGVASSKLASLKDFEFIRESIVSLLEPAACALVISLLWLQVASAATPLVGDVDGDGHTDIGIWDATRARALLDSTQDGKIDGITPPLGIATDLPFLGDWDGDGVETLALYRSSTNQVIWSNSNSDGTYAVRLVTAVGNSGGIPVRGDWDGDGRDGFAIYDVSAKDLLFYQDISGPQYAIHSIGNPGDLPVTGDWNNDGSDGYGVYRPATCEFWLVDVLGAAPTRHLPSVGIPGDIPLAGKWQGQSNWSIGLFRPSTLQFVLFDTLSVASYQAVSWLDPMSVIPTSGRQAVYTGGVPHASITGTARLTFDVWDSFLLLGIYGIGDALNEQGQNVFTELQSAGFNAAQLWPSLSVDEALVESSGTNIKLIPRLTEYDLNAHNNDTRIFGWYVWDEPNGAATLATLQQLYDTYKPIATRPLFHTNTPPGAPLWSSIAALGDAGAADDYPIHSPALGTQSIESIANTMTALRAAMPSSSPVWFVPQAFASNNPGDSWVMPAASPVPRYGVCGVCSWR